MIPYPELFGYRRIPPFHPILYLPESPLYRVFRNKSSQTRRSCGLENPYLRGSMLSLLEIVSSVITAVRSLVQLSIASDWHLHCRDFSRYGQTPQKA